MPGFVSGFVSKNVVDPSDGLSEDLAEKFSVLFCRYKVGVTLSSLMSQNHHFGAFFREFSDGCFAVRPYSGVFKDLSAVWVNRRVEVNPD